LVNILWHVLDANVYAEVDGKDSASSLLDDWRLDGITHLRRKYTQTETSSGYGHNHRRFLNLLAGTRNLHATDPRGNIYGVQGLYEDFGILFPDCSLELLDVYGAFAQRYIEHEKDLFVLSFCNSPVMSSYLLSWVPDWCYSLSASIYRSPKGREPWEASLSTSVIYSCSNDFQILVLEGFILDRINQAGPWLPSQDETTYQGKLSLEEEQGLKERHANKP
jgi:hypothetical protein